MVFILGQVILEINSLSFDFLHGVAQCFIFRVEVVGGFRVTVIFLSALIIRDLACPFAL
jgi:hypothetical protein